MYLHISILLLLPFVLFAQEEPMHENVITKTYTLTTTSTSTTTVSMITSAMIVPHVNQTMPTGIGMTASAPVPAPSSTYKGDSPYVSGPPAPPKETTPIMTGNGAKYSCGDKVIVGVVGLAAILAMW